MANTYHYLRGGDSAYALRLSETLRGEGHEIVPFAMASERNLASPHGSYFAGELDYPAMQAQGGLQNAWRVISNSIYNRQARQQVKRLLADVKPDLCHLHSVMHHLTASIVLEMRRARVPMVWTLHDLKSCCPTTHFLREGKICEACTGGRFYQATRHRCKRGSLAASAVTTLELYLHRLWKIYERADLLIAPSRFLRDKVIESGLRPRRIEVLPNFIDALEWPPATGDKGYALFVGRLSREKGLPTVLEACRKAGDLELVVAGSGELGGALRAECAAAGQKNVRWLGHVQDEALHRLYAGARLIVVPSTVYENCPMVVLEAAASTKPVLASRIGGIPELVEDGVSGRLIPAGDVDAWATALREAMSAPERCAEMGRRARERVERDYSTSRHVQRVEALYGEVLGQRAAGEV